MKSSKKRNTKRLLRVDKDDAVLILSSDGRVRVDFVQGVPGSPIPMHVYLGMSISGLLSNVANFADSVMAAFSQLRAGKAGEGIITPDKKIVDIQGRPISEH